MGKKELIKELKEKVKYLNQTARKYDMLQADHEHLKKKFSEVRGVLLKDKKALKILELEQEMKKQTIINEKWEQVSKEEFKWREEKLEVKEKNLDDQIQLKAAEIAYEELKKVNVDLLKLTNKAIENMPAEVHQHCEP